MPLKPANNLIWAWLSLALAMALRILPLPHSLATFNPDWVLLFLVSWIIASPERVGVTTAWFAGLLTDALTARALGQHALAYTVMAYVCLRLQPRLRFFPWLQQTLLVALLLSASRLLVFWTQSAKGPALTDELYWIPVLSGVLAWPLVHSFLSLLRRHSSAV